MTGALAALSDVQSGRTSSKCWRIATGSLDDHHEPAAPPKQWHAYLGEPTIADAVLDRILHNAHRLVLKGPSRRKPERGGPSPSNPPSATSQRRFAPITMHRSR